MGKAAVQGELVFHEVGTWGGHRDGSGRKRRKDGVAHVSREQVTRHDPMLVTIKRARGLVNLRYPAAAQVIFERVMLAQKDAFRITHFTIQDTHLHLLVEADDAAAFVNGMKGFVASLAKALNKLWGRRGRVFPERFHSRVLKSVRAVWNAIKYVLNNYLKHGVMLEKERGALREPDQFSSGRYFDGWRGYLPEVRAGSPESPVVKGCWKSSIGWKLRHAQLSLAAVPGRSSCSS